MDARTQEEADPKPTTRGRRDLTKGPITRSLLLFSLPLFGANALQSLNGTVNQIWVSHILGEAAITALGNANIVMMLMLGTVFGVGMAANILVGQAFGARDMGLVKHVMGTASTFFLGLSLFVGVFGGLLAPHILGLMRTPPVSREDAVIYLRIIFACAPATYMFMFLQMAQRGAGDSATPFWFMAMAIVIDIILNPLLIMGLGPFPKLGIAGSAVSTFVAQSVGLVAMVAHLYRRRSVLLLRGSELRLLWPDPAILRSLVVRGLPMGAQMLVMSSAAVIMISLVNRYGALTSAAYSIAATIWTYLQMPTMAIGASVSSMAAQNVGARQWDRVTATARSGVASGLIITAAFAVILYTFERQVLSILLPAQSPAIPLAMHINSIVLWAFVLFSVTFSLSGVVRATGAVWAPLLIMCVSIVGLRVPAAAFFSARWGADAIWWSFPLGTITSAALTTLYYRFGGWRRAHMLDPPAAPRAQTVPATT
jgi:putative MATE family efflux protein